METQQTFELSVDTAHTERESQPERDTGRALQEFAETFEVTDVVTAQALTDWRNDIKTWINTNPKLAELQKEITSADSVHKFLCDIRNSILTPREQAVAIANRKLIDWDQQQKRLAAIAEAERLAAERKAEDDRRIKEATALEAAGEHEEAAAVIEAPIVHAPPPPAPRAATPTGGRIGKNWKAEVTHKANFIAAIAAHGNPDLFKTVAAHLTANPALLNLVEVNQTALNAMARAQEANLSLAGVRVYDAGKASAIGTRR